MSRARPETLPLPLPGPQTPGPDQGGQAHGRLLRRITTRRNLVPEHRTGIPEVSPSCPRPGGGESQGEGVKRQREEEDELCGTASGPPWGAA